MRTSMIRSSAKMLALSGILIFSGMSSICDAAQVSVGPESCTQQLNRCVAWRQIHGPSGSEGLCVTVFKRCIRSGVWDATSTFPYGGARITGMIRR